MTYYDLNMNSKRINNCQDPSAAQDVATKNYVDTNIAPFFYPNSKLAGRANGIIASNVDSPLTGQLSIVTQAPYFYAVYLRAGTVVTNGLINPVLSGNDIRMYFGIYSKSGLLLATSALITYPTGFPFVNIVYQLPLSSPYTVPTSDFYYMCIYMEKQQTSPQFIGAGIAGSNPTINFPQTAQEVNTGNLSVFRSAITNLTISTGPLWANLNVYTLQGLSQQIWLGLN